MNPTKGHSHGCPFFYTFDRNMDISMNMNSHSHTSITAMMIAKALAQADLTYIASCFSNAGFIVKLPTRGILQIYQTPSSYPVHLPPPGQVLISIGIHGDETGPIELLAHTLHGLMKQPQTLAVDLMIVVGNIDAIAQGKRFIDTDLNRLFHTNRPHHESKEAKRAKDIIRATKDFFAENIHGEKWHLDLHATIRPSHYRNFAIIADLQSDNKKRALISYLGAADIAAIVFNPKSAGTYSYFTAEHFGTISATVELGKVAPLGQNDVNTLKNMQVMLDKLLCAIPVSSETFNTRPAPQIFKVVQEIIKLSDDFHMTCDGNTQNFTAMTQGTIIARDGTTIYTVRHEQEHIVFPNPNVHIGQRAGLMVVKQIKLSR